MRDLLFSSQRLRLTIWLAILLIVTVELLGTLGLWHGVNHSQSLYQRQPKPLTLLTEIHQMVLHNHIHILAASNHLEYPALNEQRPMSNHLDVIIRNYGVIAQQIKNLKSFQLTSDDIEFIAGIDEALTKMRYEFIKPYYDSVQQGDTVTAETLLLDVFEPLNRSYDSNHHQLKYSLANYNELNAGDNSYIFLESISLYLIIIGIIIFVIAAYLIYSAFRQKYSLLINIINTVDEPIYVKDKEGHFIFANQLAADLYHTTPEEMLDRDEHFFEDSSEELQQRLTSEQEVLTKLTKQSDVETRTDMMTGEPNDFQSYKVPYTSSDGSSYAIIITRNITDKRQLESAYERSLKRLKAVLDVSQEGIWDWNARSNETTFDSKCKKILGVYDSDNYYDEFMRSIHPEDKDLVVQALDDLLANNIPYDLKMRIIRPADGRLAWIWDRCVVIERDAFGEATWVVGIVQELDAPQPDADIS